MSAPSPSRAEWIAHQVERWTGTPPDGEPIVFDDTTHYMSIDWGHVVDLQGQLFLVRGHEREGRFGIQEQPKFWVKRAIELSTGRLYILKMTIDERFKAQIGETEFLCVRDAQKEARVLELTRGHPRFMQGRTVADVRGNLVRVIEYIPGDNLLAHLRSLGLPHRVYFQERFPLMMKETLACLHSLEILHDAGLCHGDIRNDHLLLDRDRASLRWIDFDLWQETLDFDVWSVGNILHCVVAGGFLTFRGATTVDPEVAGRLDADDASLFFPFRVMNLGKAYPYLPAKLNQILAHFSVGGRVRYGRLRELVEDLGDCGVAAGWW